MPRLILAIFGQNEKALLKKVCITSAAAVSFLLETAT
jgi:hypothetical protein